MVPDLLFHASLALYWLAMIRLLRRLEARGLLGLAAIVVQLAVVGGVGSAGFALLAERGAFGALGFLAGAVFLHSPLVLLGCARFLLRGTSARLALAGALGLGLIGANAFWNEPTWLEVTHTRLPCTNLRRPLKVAVVADLQTDRVGAYEQRVIETLMAEEPDLILFPGDYIQPDGRRPDSRETEGRALRDLLVSQGLTAPLGAFAVPGNCDPRGWHEVFDGLPVHTFLSSSRIEEGDLAITGLVLHDSSDPRLRLDPVPGRFHIALGHQPDFALGEPEADLVVAGHCHGGQVRMPFLGPILTLSRIPRSWAAGATRLDEDTWLYVSRGVGMERGWAPRLRFLLRPELAILELVPAGQETASPR